MVARPVDEALEGKVTCWGQDCRQVGGHATLVRFTPDLSVALVLCPEHEFQLRDYAACPIYERMPGAA